MMRHLTCKQCNMYVVIFVLCRSVVQFTPTRQEDQLQFIIEDIRLQCQYNYSVQLFFRLCNIGPLDMFGSFVFFLDIFYTQLSGPGIELAIMISFIKLRSALKLIGSQDFVKNGFDYNKN